MIGCWTPAGNKQNVNTNERWRSHFQTTDYVWRNCKIKLPPPDCLTLWSHIASKTSGKSVQFYDDVFWKVLCMPRINAHIFYRWSSSSLLFHSTTTGFLFKILHSSDEILEPWLTSSLTTTLDTLRFGLIKTKTSGPQIQCYDDSRLIWK